MGIDQSFTCTGVVLLKDSKVVDAWKLVTDKTEDKFTRAWKMAGYIHELCEQHKPNFVAMEGLAFGGVGNATRDLAGLQFVVATQILFKYNGVLNIIAPGTIKKLATGKGNSKKSLLLENLPAEVREFFDDMGVKKTTGLLDLTDAYWIARTDEASRIKL